MAGESILKNFEEITNSRLADRIKNSDIFKTMKHSGNYFLAQMVSTGLSFISIPIFTRLFTEADYGIVSVFTAYVSFFIVILTLNSHTAVSRYYFEESEDFDKFIGTTIILSSITFTLSTFLFFAFYEQINNFLKLPAPLPLILILVCAFSIIEKIYLQLLYSQRRSKEAATLNITKGTVTLIIAILITYSLTFNRYMGKIAALVIMGFFVAIYCFFKISQNMEFTFEKAHIKYILNYAIPLIPYALSSVILAVFDRIMINFEIDSAAAGLYSLGYNIALLLSMVISATRTALMPDFYKFLNNEQYDRINALVDKIFSIVSFVALGLILFSREIVMILADKRFHPGLVVVPIVVIGYVFYGMFTVYTRYISYSKRTVYSSISMIVSGIFNIVLNSIFIPEFGYIAAAYTTVFSYFLLFLMTWFSSKYIIKIKITPLWVVWKPTVLLFIFLGVFLFLTQSITDIVLLLFIKLGITSIFFIIVFYKELEKLYKMI